MSGEMMLFPATVEEFMEQYKVVDRDHALSNGAEFVPVFRMRQWFDHLQAPPITNADCIRYMSDEQLAVFLEDNVCPPPNRISDCLIDHRREMTPDECHKCWLNWLKGEVKDDH